MAPRAIACASGAPRPASAAASTRAARPRGRLKCLETSCKKRSLGVSSGHECVIDSMRSPSRRRLRNGACRLGMHGLRRSTRPSIKLATCKSLGIPRTRTVSPALRAGTTVINRREHRNEPQASLPSHCFNCNPSNSLYAEITGCSACHSRCAGRRTHATLPLFPCCSTSLCTLPFCRCKCSSTPAQSLRTHRPAAVLRRQEQTLRIRLRSCPLNASSVK